MIALIQVAVSVGIEPAETFAGNGKRYSQPLRHPADGQKFSQADFIVVVLSASLMKISEGSATSSA